MDEKINGWAEESVQDEVEEPPLYQVLLHNDDFTTMDFVVEILVEIFHKSPSEATNIMLSVHNSGVGACGVYTLEIAEEKIQAVQTRARTAEFPLKVSKEKV